MNKLIITMLVLLLIAIAAVGGYWFATGGSFSDVKENLASRITKAAGDNSMSGSVPDSMQNASMENDKKEKVPLFYRHPMNPEITSPLPAKDSMNMDYIPVFADSDTDSDNAPVGTVKIDPVTVQNIGVRTAIAEEKTMSRNIRAAGRVTYDEGRIVRLHPKVEGWIESLYINKVGDKVNKNVDLLSIYSPDLVASQQEYLLALNSLEILQKSPFEDIRRGAKDLVTTSRERLQFLDMPHHQILELERTRKIKKYLHMHSPFDGIVIDIGIREGEYVTPAKELYSLANLSKVWIYADIYESELPWVHEGDPVEMKLVGIPGKIFEGTLAYIFPFAEAKTRSIRVRLEFDNPDLLLKPDMFADVTIKAQQQLKAITIPEEAIVRSGQREQVFIVRDSGKFEPREVKPGLNSDGMVQILEGITAGEEVVTSSQFLIDSESKLRESTAKMFEAINADNAIKSDLKKSPMEERKSDASMQMETAVKMESGSKDEMKCGASMNMKDGNPVHSGEHAHD